MPPADRSVPPISWGSLLVRSRQGDLDAFESLVTACEQRVLRVAYRITGNLEDAQDAAQEAFLRLYRSRDRFDERRPLEAWLLRIVVNEARDLLEKRRNASLHPIVEGEIESNDRTGSAESSALGDELAAKVEDALSELSPRLRTVFVLRDLEGLPTDEVARLLGCTRITVRRHSADARVRIREILNKRHPGLL